MEMQLTPLVATAIFVLACLAGFQYRRAWVKEKPRVQLWFYGVSALLCLAIVAFVPVVSS